MSRQLISVVIPAYNEEECIDELGRRLGIVFDGLPDFDFEVFLVDNGSVDSTGALITQLHERDSRFKLVQLARNFRTDGGITAGLEYATGDACIIMNADLQDPPELIPTFIDRWRAGYENIYMEVTRRKGTGPLRTFNSKAFYWLAGKLTDNRVPRNVSDFRLVDRKVYEVVRTMDERNRFVRGLFGWVGFSSIGVKADRPERFGGRSKAHSLAVLDLAFKGIFAHSYIPLKLITIIGITLSALSFLAIIPLFIIWSVYGVPFAGFGSLISLILLFLSLVMLMLGILSEYVGLIYEEVKGRPNFIVRATLGIDRVERAEAQRTDP